MENIATVFYNDEDDCLDYECTHNNVEYDYDYAETEKNREILHELYQYCLSPRETLHELYQYCLRPRETLHELYQYCLSPSLYETGYNLLPLFGCIILFRLFVHIRCISQKLFHILSAIMGLYIIHHYMHESLIVLIVYVLFSYAILYALKKWHSDIGVFLSSFLIIVYCELFMQSITWHKVRSTIMIVMMKGISVAIDKYGSNNLPDVYSYMGYMFCGVTCLFGPWISFHDYLLLRSNIQTKQWHVIICGIGYAFLSFVFLSISNCWMQWIFVDSSWKWWIAYRDALSFRASHYFVSFMGSALLVLGGFPLSTSVIVKPLYIEFPHSLVHVVVYWNIPMHYWLKTYIFRPSIKNFGSFGAIIITYLMSSLLHGLNFQLAAVLLSLGFYTYVEFQLRAMLADALDACIASKQCIKEKCVHKYNSSNCWLVFMTNLIFSGLAMFHLAYLGVVFDTSDLQETGYNYSHTINKWTKLGFASHWIALATYCIYFLIK